jgi:hypothetical protein
LLRALRHQIRENFDGEQSILDTADDDDDDDFIP